jgi:hypothetical protein
MTRPTRAPRPTSVSRNSPWPTSPETSSPRTAMRSSASTRHLWRVRVLRRADRQVSTPGRSLVRPYAGHAREDRSAAERQPPHDSPRSTPPRRASRLLVLALAASWLVCRRPGEQDLGARALSRCGAAKCSVSFLRLVPGPQQWCGLLARHRQHVGPHPARRRPSCRRHPRVAGASAAPGPGPSVCCSAGPSATSPTGWSAIRGLAGPRRRLHRLQRLVHRQCRRHRHRVRLLMAWWRSSTGCRTSVSSRRASEDPASQRPGRVDDD